VRAADLLSFVVFTSPMVLAVPALLPVLPRGELRRSEPLVLLAIAAPFVALLLALRGQNGMYSDWDVFAAGGVALSLVAAWTVGRALAIERRSAAVGVAVVLAVTAPVLEWLALAHDTDRELRRVETFVTEPPLRPAHERAATWDPLGRLRFAQ